MKGKKIDLIVLNAKKVKEMQGAYKGLVKTELYQDGKLKAVFPASASNQPRKGQKTVILNGWKFALEW